jgi:hypothetical protein
MQKIIQRFHRYVQKPWYGPLIALLAAADHFVVVIPTDGLLISSVLSTPKKWIQFSLWIIIGSTLGAFLLALCVQVFGMPFLNELIPGVLKSAFWTKSVTWVDHYGLWALFGVSSLPVMQHPAIALLALSGTSVTRIAGTVLAGRFLKYSLLGWLSSHAPHLLLRMKLFRKEL